MISWLETPQKENKKFRRREKKNRKIWTTESEEFGGKRDDLSGLLALRLLVQRCARHFEMRMVLPSVVLPLLASGSSRLRIPDALIRLPRTDRREQRGGADSGFRASDDETNRRPDQDLKAG